MNNSKISISSQDLVDDFENLVQQEFSNALENEKANFLQKFEHFKETCKRKGPIENSENGFSMSKKLNIEMKVEFPNEIWLKIITFLPCKEFFGSFALVNKHFHSLTLDHSALKYLQIGEIKNDLQLENLMKVIKYSKKLKEVQLIAGHSVEIS